MSTAQKAGLMLGMIGALSTMATSAEGGEGGRGRPVYVVPPPPPGVTVHIPLPQVYIQPPIVVRPAYPYPYYYVDRRGREGGEGGEGRR